MKEQVAELPDASVTRKVLVVTPSGKLPPEANPVVCTVIGPEQLSAPTGAVKFTTAVQTPTPVFAVAFAGQVIVGS